MDNADPRTISSADGRMRRAPPDGVRHARHTPGLPTTDEIARADLRRLLAKIKEYRDRGLDPGILSVSLRTVLRLSHEDLARLWAAAAD